MITSKFTINYIKFLVKTSSANMKTIVKKGPKKLPIRKLPHSFTSFVVKIYNCYTGILFKLSNHDSTNYCKMQLCNEQVSTGTQLHSNLMHHFAVPVYYYLLLNSKAIFLCSVYFAVNGIIAFRSILPQLHNPMSHEYYIFYSTVFTNLIVNPRSHKSESIQSDPKPKP